MLIVKGMRYGFTGPAEGIRMILGGEIAEVHVVDEDGKDHYAYYGCDRNLTFAGVGDSSKFQKIIDFFFSTLDGFSTIQEKEMYDLLDFTRDEFGEDSFYKYMKESDCPNALKLANIICYRSDNTREWNTNEGSCDPSAEKYFGADIDDPKFAEFADELFDDEFEDGDEEDEEE